MRFPLPRFAHPSPKFLVVFAFAAASGCAAHEPLDDDVGFTGPKDDGACVALGSPEAVGMLAFVNDPTTTFQILDAPHSAGGVGLDRRAAQGIIAARPIADLAALDAVPFVGLRSCVALRDFACDVQARCEATCQADAFTKPPSRTGFDAGCAAALVIAAAGDVLDEREIDVEVAQRCDQLSPDERIAFDVVAHEFDVPPDALDTRFALRSRIVGHGERVTIVSVDDLDGGQQWHIAVKDGAPILEWGSDGLSTVVDLYCPGGALQPDPDDFCVEGVARAACAEHERTTRAANGTIADLTASPDPLISAGARGYAALTGAATASPLALELAVCPFDQSARVNASGAAGPQIVVVGEALSRIWLLAGGPSDDSLALRCDELLEL